MEPLTVVLAAAGALAAALLVRRLLRPRALPPHQQVAACPACGWQGVVSRYAGRCPRCNAGLGDQRARRRPGA